MASTGNEVPQNSYLSILSLHGSQSPWWFWPIISQQGPLKGAPQLNSNKVSMQQRGKRASQARAKSSRVLNGAQGLDAGAHRPCCPIALQDQNPGTALQTDKEQPAWTALRALTNIPLGVSCITIHFAIAVLLPVFRNRDCKAHFLWLGLYVSSRDGLFFPGSTCLIYLLFQIRSKSFVFSFKDTRQEA